MTWGNEAAGDPAYHRVPFTCPNCLESDEAVPQRGLECGFCPAVLEILPGGTCILLRVKERDGDE